MGVGAGWLLAILVPVYFTPSLIAISLSHQQLASILLLNILGWMVLPWIVAFVRACRHPGFDRVSRLLEAQARREMQQFRDRQSVVYGKSVSVRVGLGGRRRIKKKNRNKINKD